METLSKTKLRLGGSFFKASIPFNGIDDALEINIFESEENADHNFIYSMMSDELKSLVIVSKNEISIYGDDKYKGAIEEYLSGKIITATKAFYFPPKD